MCDVATRVARHPRTLHATSPPAGTVKGSAPPAARSCHRAHTRFSLLRFTRDAAAEPTAGRHVSMFKRSPRNAPSRHQDRPADEAGARALTHAHTCSFAREPTRMADGRQEAQQHQQDDGQAAAPVRHARSGRPAPSRGEWMEEVADPAARGETVRE